MFDRVLVANRGEIAVRIIRTLRRLGIGSVAVYSDADVSARHVREADEAIRIGPAAAMQSYLRVDRIVEAALRSGARAVHPGYGFLAENPALARACAAVGLVFVGPPVAAIETMGDKIRAKRTVSASGVPVVPGLDEVGPTDDALLAAIAAVGFPVLLKPSAGGGGKGMRRVAEPARLADELAAARREALVSFGDDTLLVERFVSRPRHLEIQVLADAHGNVVHLGERECSLQRRHQKIVEEAPSPDLAPGVRAAMGAAAVAAARACGYTNAGTVEFIVSADDPAEFFFMEMNTRLQVEHPVTEAVYGVDLVELQLRIAAGEVLPFTQEELTPRGHAIEARVYAEDPSRGFLPTGGTIAALDEPEGEGIRVDSGLAEGTIVGSDYDPMLAKVIAWGPDREVARQRLDRALATTRILGVTTNVAFLRGLLADTDVVRGALDTALVERHLADAPPAEIPDDALIAALLARATVEAEHAPGDPWTSLDGWRLGGNVAQVQAFDVPGRGEVGVTHRRTATGWEVAVGDSTARSVTARRRADRLDLTIDGRTSVWNVASVGGVVWVAGDRGAWPITPAFRRPLRGHQRSVGTGLVRSPMPGRVTALLVAEGDTVVAGQPLAVVEAMKMEHSLRSPIAGTVGTVHVRLGDQVALDAPLVTVDPEGALP